MSSKQFCLKWNNFQSNILNAFESLQSTEDLTDVTLTCDGISLKAHKFILSACSPYFRTVFKENPCPHPIIILKDVLYTDLIAIINFMYHGEVLVSEEQLSTFLQTAKLLQVSGLNNANDNYNTKKSPKKTKYYSNRGDTCSDYVVKRPKLFPKPKLSKASSPISDISNDNNSIKEQQQQKELVEGGYERKIDCEEEQQQQQIADINENVGSIVEKGEQSSILEAALEVREPKAGSILERSLTLQANAGKSPSSLSRTQETTNPIQHDMPKSVFIPRKPPEFDPATIEKFPLRPGSSGSSSPLIFDRPTEFLHHTIKIEEDSYDSSETLQDDSGGTQRDVQISRVVDVQPHHSSQCGNCPHCGKVYSNQSALKYHVRLVHSDLTNMYCCHLCPEAFDYRESYKKHMVEVHCVRN